MLTGTDLADRNIVTVDDLQFSTPSLFLQNFGQGNEFNIRGIGKSESNIQTPSGTVTYRDGVATFGGFFQDEPFYDIAGIEVLRGPQGTFAGQNATGGAVFIREVDPSLTAGYDGYAQVQVGNYSDYGVQGAANLPISDTLAARVAINGESRDSFFHIQGPYTGNPGDLREGDARLSLLWQPTPKLEILGKIDLNYVENGGYPAGAAVGPNNTRANPFNIASDARLEGVDSFLRADVRATYTLDDGIKIRNIFGYQSGRTSQKIDLDGTDQLVPVPPPAAPAVFSPEAFSDHATENILSDEVNIISPGDGPLTWIVGAYAQKDTTKIPPGGFLGILPGLVVGTVNTSYKDSAAGFGQITYALSPTLKLQVGARYTSSNFTQDSFVTLSTTSGILLLKIPGDAKQSDSAFTGKVGLDWTPTPRDLIYAFVASGHKAGGINGEGSPVTGAPPPLFQPEDVIDYELGWKSSFFDRHLVTQLGAFYNTYKRFQLDFIDPLTQVDQIKNTVGNSTLDGVEAQAQMVVGDLSADVNASWVHTELGTIYATDFRFNAASVACNTATGPASATCTALGGRSLPNAPEYTFNAGVQYAFQLQDGAKLTPRIDYAYQSHTWATAFQAFPLDYLGARNLLKAELNYDQGPWRVSLYGTNLTNQVYLVSTNHNLAYPGAPRQFGLRINRKF